MNVGNYSKIYACWKIYRFFVSYRMEILDSDGMEESG
jgi:hypothetical protein